MEVACLSNFTKYMTFSPDLTFYCRIAQNMTDFPHSSVQLDEKSADHGQFSPDRFIQLHKMFQRPHAIFYTAKAGKDRKK